MVTLFPISCTPPPNYKRIFTIFQKSKPPPKNGMASQTFRLHSQSGTIYSFASSCSQNTTTKRKTFCRSRTVLLSFLKKGGNRGANTVVAEDILTLPHDNCCHTGCLFLRKRTPPHCRKHPIYISTELDEIFPMTPLSVSQATQVSRKWYFEKQITPGVLYSVNYGNRPRPGWAPLSAPRQVETAHSSERSTM